MPWADFFVRSGISFTFLFRGRGASFIHELRAGDNGLDQGGEAIVVGSQHGSHTLHGGFIGEQERPAKSVCEEFSAEIVNEILLAMLADVGLDTFRPR